MVDHKKLFKKMEKKGISKEIIDGVKMMFNNLIIPSQNKEHHLGRGLGQGWAISCLLFNIFTDDLTDLYIREQDIYP